MKAHGLTVGLRWVRAGLSAVGEAGIPGVAVECADIRRNTGGEAGLWAVTDTEERKHGERTGLDTLVVHAVNGGNWVWGAFLSSAS